MKYFVALSFQNRKTLQPYTEQIKNLARSNNDECVVFVEKQLPSTTPKEMMQSALSELITADVLIAEGSTKEVGVGIEMGFAHALNIPIVLIRKRGSEPSTTMEGISQDDPIEYETGTDLYQILGERLSTIHSRQQTDNRINDPTTQLLLKEAWLNAEILFEEYRVRHNEPMTDDEVFYFRYNLASEYLKEKEFQETDLLHMYQRQPDQQTRQKDVEKRLNDITDAQMRFDSRLKEYEVKTHLSADTRLGLQRGVFNFMWRERKEALQKPEGDVRRPSPLPIK